MLGGAVAIVVELSTSVAPFYAFSYGAETHVSYESELLRTALIGFLRCGHSVVIVIL